MQLFDQAFVYNLILFYATGGGFFVARRYLYIPIRLRLALMQGLSDLTRLLHSLAGKDFCNQAFRWLDTDILNPAQKF